jgi:predicted membrane-bound mannosyltransferase
MWSTKETFVITLVAAGLALALNHFWNRNLDASGLPINARRLNLVHVAAAFGICLLVWLLMFSSFFTNARGLPDSFRTYSSWFHRAAGDSAHIHPWYFYFERLFFFHVHKGPIWSEGLIFLLALIGAMAAFARKGLSDANASFVRFLALYTLVLTAAYSLISYKTPWCLLNFWLGMILLAGVGSAVLIHAARFQWAETVATILLLAGAGQLAAQAWQAAVPRAADRNNPYVYAQTSPGVLELVEKINGLAEVSQAKHHLRINVIASGGDFWPLPWFLRSFDQVGWWEKLPEDPFAPVMIVSADLKPGLAERESHPMREVFELRPGAFLKLYVESQLWRDYVANSSGR